MLNRGLTKKRLGSVNTKVLLASLGEKIEEHSETVRRVNDIVTMTIFQTVI